jgi:glycosyltransferase involved in cell wall biosynthesis
MVTGAYFPELSGGGLQARAVVRALASDADFRVLTTSTDASLPARAVEQGVPIRRVYVDVRQRLSEVTAAFRLAFGFVWLGSRVDLVNLHGFSRKAILLVALSRLFRKGFILTLQTGVQDEPDTVRSMGRWAFWAYRSADLYLSVSPGLSRAYLDSGLPRERLRQVCNAVDTDRFKPASEAERRALREELGLPQGVPLVLFVGVFTKDKRPHGLYSAWARLATSGVRSAVVFIGATRSTNVEVDAGLRETIRNRALADGLDDQVFFVESTHTIEKYFRAADLYALPSVREGLPIALLEAMAAGLPCVASRLPGATDALIEHRVNGLLVEPGDEAELSAAIGAVIGNPGMAAQLGAAARGTIVARYSMQGTAADWLTAYRDVAERRVAIARRREPA